MKMYAILATCALTVASTALASTPDDKQIAAIVAVANQVDIDAGKLAESKSKDERVKEFARTMVTDHASVNESAVALVTKLGVKPEPNETSKSLEKGGEENVARLRTLSGAEFDKAYIEHEVAYHEQVLDALDNVLIPNAKNAELKALLVKVRPAFVAHLDHAKNIRSTLFE